MKTTASATWSSRIDGLRSREKVTSTAVPSYRRRASFAKRFSVYACTESGTEECWALTWSCITEAPFTIVAMTTLAI